MSAERSLHQVAISEAMKRYWRKRKAEPYALTPTRRNEEDGIHKAVTQYLSWCLPEEACWFPIPNGGFRWQSEGERMRRQGMVRAGVPDICVVNRGRAIFLEIKTDIGRLSPVQRQMHDKLARAEADVFVVRSQGDVQRVLSECGVRLRGRVG